MRSSSRRALVLLHDLFWLALIAAPAVLVVVWIRRWPPAPPRVTWETAYAAYGEVAAMLGLFGLVGVLLVFLAEFSTGRLHAWARGDA